ncbi:hypothetical protein DL96DRAFT_1595990 [Flagelloscypha sp. PMI_526]|nr:hypothetical protein DL96DRAFT_1595990 [Flagelloscypha sp. PMI_526]
MEATHNLPLDVLRLLFEFSASANFESAKTLSLISKEVQLWTDPHLFQIVQGFGISHTKRLKISLGDRMCMSNTSPRLILARRYVRAVAWEKHPPDKIGIEMALEIFPNLVQLCIRSCLPYGPESMPHGFVITHSYPTLRRMTTSLLGHSPFPPNIFESPFWTTLTHLQIKYLRFKYDFEPSFPSPLFINMRSLTRLALLYTYHVELDVDIALSRIKETLPSSLILCLLSLAAPPDLDRGPWLAELVKASFKVDERIVIWSTESGDDTENIVVTSHTFQEWCGIQDGVQTIWEMGEAILKRRQEDGFVMVEGSAGSVLVSGK